MLDAYLKLVIALMALDVPVEHSLQFSSRGVTKMKQGTVTSVVLRPDLTPEDTVIALSHELGHVLDWIIKPLTPEESASAGSHGELTLPDREKSAWDKAQHVLCNLGVFEQLGERFNQFKAEAFRSRAVLTAAEEKNKMNVSKWTADGEGGLQCLLYWNVDGSEEDMVVLKVRQDLKSGEFVWRADKQDIFGIQGNNEDLATAQAEAEAAGLLGEDYWRLVYGE